MSLKMSDLRICVVGSCRWVCTHVLSACVLCTCCSCVVHVCVCVYWCLSVGSRPPLSNRDWTMPSGSCVTTPRSERYVTLSSTLHFLSSPHLVLIVHLHVFYVCSFVRVSFYTPLVSDRFWFMQNWFLILDFDTDSDS